MFNKIKNRVDKELRRFASRIDKLYWLNSISPVLSESLKNFILRPGKRARPVLFIAGYLGFSRQKAAGLYTSALSIELLHDFMLIHDDIIDKSGTRRGEPSLHKALDKYLPRGKRLKFNGQDLAIVAGDVLYAMAIDTFLCIKENPKNKELGLKKFIEAAIYTGGGEFIELLYGMKGLGKITKEDIYRIYKLKTAFYTFACPLSIGAILAGSSKKEIEIISSCGLYLGCAFQIKDDILGMFSDEKKTGKSALVDLQEAKKTILIWHAFNHSSSKDKAQMRDIMRKEKITGSDLLKMRRIIIASGAKEFAEKEIARLKDKALQLLHSSKMFPLYKTSLYNYSQEILS